MTQLKTITTNGGARFTVAAGEAARFASLLNDLEASGYPIKGEQSGGYNDRNIAGTNTKSQHAFGSAVDVNWTDNARGTKGNIDPEKARSLAERHGFVWGGDWSNPDPMHFELRRGERPASEQRTVQSAGIPAAPAPQDNGGGEMDLMAMLSQLMGSSGTEATAAPTQGAPQFGSMAPPEAPKQDTQTQMALAAMPQLGTQKPMDPMQLAPMRAGVDLGRLRQVIAARSRLGSAA